LVAVIVAASIGLVSTPAYGALSDRLGRRPIYLFGAVVSLVFSFAYIPMIDTKSIPLIVLATVIGLNLGHDAMYGPQAAFFSESFGTRSRYTGYQLAGVLGGGIAPLVAASLLTLGPSGGFYVSVYMAAMCVITIASVLWATETYRTDVAEEAANVRRRAAGPERPAAG